MITDISGHSLSIPVGGYKVQYMHRPNCKINVLAKINIRFLLTDINVKSGVALSFHAMAIHSPDSAKKVSTEILPLVFLAMHGTPKEDGEQANTCVYLGTQTLEF